MTIITMVFLMSLTILVMDVAGMKWLAGGAPFVALMEVGTRRAQRIAIGVHMITNVLNSKEADNQSFKTD